jgi:hypothetical protein
MKRLEVEIENEFQFQLDILSEWHVGVYVLTKDKAQLFHNQSR